MEETETELLDNVKMRDLDNRRGSGAIILEKELYEILKPIFKDKELVIRYKRDSAEICIKEWKLRYE
jgi:hypothetical protein